MATKTTATKKRTAKTSIPEGRVVKRSPTLMSAEAQMNTADNTLDMGITGLAKAITGELTVPEQAKALTILRTHAKDVAALEKMVKDAMLNMLKAEGEAYGKGSLKVERDGWLLEARVMRSGPDAKKLEALLRAKRIDPMKYMNTEVKYSVNEDGIKHALEAGDLTVDELAACSADVTYAVQSPKQV